jgi:hypothetical protein
MGRLVGWYTNGGMHDECGHWHASGLHYQWHGPGLRIGLAPTLWGWPVWG